MLDVKVLSNYVNERFEFLGPNKKQEITRLVFEISKRENKDFREILSDELRKGERFLTFKKNLLKRRYPSFRAREIKEELNLPSINIDQSLSVEIKKKLKIYPENIFVEGELLNSDIVKRIKKRFDNSKISIIPSYSEYIKEKNFTISDYNDRLNNFFIVNERYDFFINCPCSQNSVCCNYKILKLGTGCAFECMYCYMQAYINSPGIVIPANIKDFFDRFPYQEQYLRLGNGQFTDSLVFDHITEYSPLIIDFFRKFPKIHFEFKTKSDNIDLLLKVKPSENIIVSWSLNPQKIIREVEYYTPSLKGRLNAAHKCLEAGYKVAFHFDPIMFYKCWEEEYKDVLEKVFHIIPEDRIAWISLGAFRMTSRLKQVIENRFPDNKILDQEMLPGYDGKLRYGPEVRFKIYKNMQRWIRALSKKVPVYLCMEEMDMCKRAGIFPLKEWLN